MKRVASTSRRDSSGGWDEVGGAAARDGKEGIAIELSQ